MAKKNSNTLGSWAFLAGVIIAIVIGIIGNSSANLNQWLTVALVVIGLIVGFVNVTSDEAMGFLTTTAILVVVMYTGQSALNSFNTFWPLQLVKNIFTSLNVLFVSATIVVAVKTVFALARD